MSQVSCAHCGQVFRVNRIDEERDYFCCAGCALRARVPVGPEGNFPVNRDLLLALTVGFLYFNQLLDWGLSSLLARQDRLVLAQRFAWGSVILALIVWLGLLLLQRRAGPLRGKDYVVAVVSFTVMAASFRSAGEAGGLLAAANAVFFIWSFRGVIRRKNRG